jgi:LytS/YehU family sensor histidine kinase
MLPRRPDFLPPNNEGVPPFNPFILFRRLGVYTHSSQFLVVFIISTGWKAISQWYAEKQRLQELENSMVQAELSFLKSQIHPHFLFNCLNSIYYLALSKNDRAPEAILSLSDFLRFVTTESNQSRIPMEKEIRMLEEYIHLQSLRASEKFELKFQLNGDFRNRTIMPLTFVPFVENAFKYGISAHTNCFIHISVTLENGRLMFTCDNSIITGLKDRNSSTGVGLENIRKRLKLAYPGRHSLEIKADRTAFHVKLQIDSE